MAELIGFGIWLLAVALILLFLAGAACEDNDDE